MALFRGGPSGLLSAVFPEKRLFIQSAGSTRYLRLTPTSQFVSGAAGLTLVAWMAVVSAKVAIDFVGFNPAPTEGVVVHDATQARIDALAGERDRRAAE